jgi:hypothetical protein
MTPTLERTGVGSNSPLLTRSWFLAIFPPMGLGSKSGSAGRVSAQARIVDLDEYYWWGGTYQGNRSTRQTKGQRERRATHERHVRFQVLITPPDGGPEVNSKTPKIKGSARQIGEIGWSLRQVHTYVLYDPGHPSKCEIDTERLDREYGSVDGPHGPEHRLAIPIPDQNANIQVLSAEDVTHAQQPAGGDDDVDKLNKLAEMHSSGALSDDEFAAAKARLLGT